MNLNVTDLLTAYARRTQELSAALRDVLDADARCTTAEEGPARDEALERSGVARARARAVLDVPAIAHISGTGYSVEHAERLN